MWVREEIEVADAECAKASGMSAVSRYALLLLATQVETLNLRPLLRGRGPNVVLMVIDDGHPDEVATNAVEGSVTDRRARLIV